MIVNDRHLAEINAPKQTIRGRVELLRGSTLERICTCGDILSELAIERTGEGKFFGFGICQKLRTVLIDMDGDLNITTEHTMDVAFGAGEDFIHPFPRFYVQEVERDEVGNTITVSAYDILFKAEKFKVSELHIEAPYTIRAMAAACAYVLNVPLKFVNINEDTFDVNYPEGANLDDTESLRAVLNAIAEATQTIYYINDKWELVFRRLNKAEWADLTIYKEQYMELASGESRTLSNIAHVSELGDNTATVGDDSGITQFVRENPFWNLRNDIGDLLELAQANIAGLTISQFEAYWSGNYLLEIGDKIKFEKNDGSALSTYLLDDTIYYAGTLEEQTRWQYDENEGETITNPVSLGDALNQTYARVDKANQRIDMYVGIVNEHEKKVSQLIIDTDGITSRVERAESNIENADAKINETLSSMEAKIDANAATFTAFKENIDNNGVSFVKTTVGRFDDSGLTISQDGVATSTNVNADGLVVYLGGIYTETDENTGMTRIANEKLLEANNQGVVAKDLHATTWLRVGGRSRFENYESNRTGCFWIGG